MPVGVILVALAAATVVLAVVGMRGFVRRTIS
jgi:hypothetical protein